VTGKCVIYARVSTEEQRLQGASPDAQVDACRELARRKGLTVHRVVRDVGTATIEAVDRPKLQGVLDDLEAGRADTLIVWNTDRFSRNLRDAVGLIEDWFGARSPWRLLSATQDIDTRTPAGRLTLNVMLSVSQYEAEQTRARTKATASWFRKNGWAWGPVPYGWRAGARTPEGRTVLEEDPDEQAVVELARELRAKGLSLRDVALELARRGARSRSGGAFHAMQVSRMVDDAAARAAS
jgi:site-specific DNA recombinase